MNNRPILTLDTFKKDSKSSPSVEESAKNEKVKPVISEDQNKKSSVKPNESVNSQSKKLTSQEIKANHKAKYIATLKKLRKLYPKCFSIPLRPLAVGIHHAIWEEEAKKSEDEKISKTTVRRFLLVYTGSRAYREAIIAGGERVDLQGNEVEKVSDKHIEFADQSLKDWNNKRIS